MLSFRPPRSRLRVTPAFALALLALFVSLGGGAYAARGLITGAQIKDGTITGAKVKNGSLTLRDLNSHTRAALVGKRGVTGRRGATGLGGVVGAQGGQGPAAHAPFEAGRVIMSPGDPARTITTQGGVAIVMSCASVTTTGWAWGTAANITATTDIGQFSLANGLADQMLNGTDPDPNQIFPYDFAGSFLEYWNAGGAIVRTYGHLEITQNACELSDFRGVVYA